MHMSQVALDGVTFVQHSSCNQLSHIEHWTHSSPGNDSLQNPSHIGHWALSSLPVSAGTVALLFGATFAIYANQNCCRLTTVGTGCRRDTPLSFWGWDFYRFVDTCQTTFIAIKYFMWLKLVLVQHSSQIVCSGQAHDWLQPLASEEIMWDCTWETQPQSHDQPFCCPNWNCF